MGTLPSFPGPLTKEHPLCIGCPLHMSFSNWGFVWPRVCGMFAKVRMKILERESNKGMRFKWKEDQRNFTKKFLVQYDYILRNF